MKRCGDSGRNNWLPSRWRSTRLSLSGSVRGLARKMLTRGPPAGASRVHPGQVVIALGVAVVDEMVCHAWAGFDDLAERLEAGSRQGLQVQYVSHG